jgi:Cu/Ag efflux pump CusA
MLSGLVQFALKQRIVVVVFAMIALAFGLDATRRLSVDAFPDVTNIQVQVATEVPGRSPDEVERMVTVPVEIGMTGLPGMTEMRSQNEPGLSIVTLVFTDDTPCISRASWSRSGWERSAPASPRDSTPCSAPSPRRSAKSTSTPWKTPMTANGP